MALKWWKVQRELKRLVFQFNDLPKSIASLPKRMVQEKRLKRYEESFEQIIKVSEGKFQPNGKFAIFLIYQKNGIPASVWHSLHYLKESGYAILAVLNRDIPQQDRGELSDICWKILDRPNFGYDFGGYKDGIRILSRSVQNIKSLIVMNDSMWFPTQGDPIATLKLSLENGEYDAVGLNQDQKVDYLADGSRSYKLGHIESYFYMLSESFVASDNFSDFWKNYKMSDDKPYTIKNGEIGFSRYAMGRGAKFYGHLRRETFILAMKDASAAELLQTLDYAVYADNKYASEAAALMSSYDGSVEWAEKAYLHICAVASRRPFNTSFPLAADRLFGTFYIKKNSQAYFHRMRMQILRGIDNGLIPPPPAPIMAEFRAMVENYERNPPKNAERTL